MDKLSEGDKVSTPEGEGVVATPDVKLDHNVKTSRVTVKLDRDGTIRSFAYGSLRKV